MPRAHPLSSGEDTVSVPDLIHDVAVSVPGVPHRVLGVAGPHDHGLRALPAVPSAGLHAAAVLTAPHESGMYLLYMISRVYTKAINK